MKSTSQSGNQQFDQPESSKITAGKRQKVTKHFIRLCAAVLVLSITWMVGCKKDSSSKNGPGPTSGSTQGQAIIYLTQDCNVGNVAVTINGINKQIRDYSTYVPDCGADSSYAIFSLEPGTYSVTANGNQESWNGSVTVTASQCTGLQLTCDGIKPIVMGLAGTPRFNLQHSAGVDFDLHVMCPDGNEINSYNTSGSNGKLDLQSSCLGSDTNYGLSGLTLTNENVWFSQGKALHGTYKFWAQFSSSCSSSMSGSYTLRVMDGLSVVATYTGTLTSANTKSQVYTFVY